MNLIASGRSAMETQVAFLHVGQDIICPTILVRSIRAHNPDAMILQCSDSSSPQVEGTNAVQRFEGDVANLMKFRTSCFSRLQIDAPTIFLDTDMLCLQRLDPPAILHDNDIAVCRRQFDTKGLIEINLKNMSLAEYSGKTLGQVWPYLGCATVTKGNNFWIECLQNLLQLHPKFHFWYGDQEAIRNVVASNKYKTALLPESIYACLPEAQPLYGNAVKLLHFKGPGRMKMMIDHAKKIRLLP
jgi:hypothetical protein